jgi:predicted dehydrogenase
VAGRPTLTAERCAILGGRTRERGAGPAHPQTSSMDTLRVGILGLGRGITHLRNFLSLENVEVVGACDRLPLRRQRGQEQVALAGGATRIVPELDDLLAMRPDAVVVASNGKRQVQHAIQAMEAGCHVLSEVPGAYTE